MPSGSGWRPALAAGSGVICPISCWCRLGGQPGCGRDGALQQMLRKIETAAGFTIIDRSGMPLSPTDAGRDFIREAQQILQAAREQTRPHPDPEGRRDAPPGSG
jgi:hypothetical protein